MSDMVDHIFSFLKPIKSFILKIGWNSNQIVPELSLPMLFVTGDNDDLVPHEQTLTLHGLAN
jgi:fermentation-respiration switch protein FrsA (DUF1100 family)